MSRTTILVVGENDFLHAGNEWDIVTALDTETAIERFQQMNFDVVVFANSNNDEVLKLSKLFLFQQPETIVLQNSTGGLLAGKIADALQKKHALNRPSFSFTDDALKAAELPIIIQ